MEFENLSSLYAFIVELSMRHFVKIADDLTYSLLHDIFSSNSKTSARCSIIF